MRFKAIILAGLMLLLAAGGANAGTDLNEVGAFLVYPLVASFSFGSADWSYNEGSSVVETFVTITNASNSSISAHVSYINGDWYDYTYCYECDFDIPLTGRDTETLVVTYDAGGIVIQSEDGTISRSCPHKFGFITVNVESASGGATLTDNILLGSEVVVDYSLGMALSLAAIPFQGKVPGGVDDSGDRVFHFDDQEYSKLPRVIAADFLAPDPSDTYGITGALALFTLGFERQFPPKVDCSVTGYDADEHPFSRSFQFGCWTFEDLCDLDPEFCYPNLSAGPCVPYGKDDDKLCDTHGWLQLNCRVDSNRDGIFESNGGVHGAIVQSASYDAVIRRNDEYAPAFDGDASWARLMYQSVTAGDAVTLLLEGSSAGLD
jgi:hypothetical protein